MTRIFAAVMLAACALPATAQSTFETGIPYDNRVTGTVPLQCDAQGKNCRAISSSNSLPVGGRQESVSLAAANTAASPATVYGGSYVFSQACTGYNSGSLVLQYLGPDGASWITMSSKTASDSSGGTLISLGSSAVVRVTLPSGSTACNATLARVP